MNHQDRELIMALAAGQLNEVAAQDASTRIAAEPEMAQELADQQAAIAALASVPEVSMTTEEQMALRTSLVAELHLDTTQAPAPLAATAKRKIPWWQPVFGVAAVAAVIAAIVVLPGNLTGSSDDSADVALVSETPTGASLEETETVQSGKDDSLDQSPSADRSAPSTTATASAEVEEGTTFEDDALDGEDLLSATRGQTTTASIEDALAAAGLTGLTPLDPSRATDVDACLERMTDPFPEGDVFPFGTTGSGADEILYVGVSDQTGISVVASIALERCELIELIP
jgi:hypothetical protein